MDALPRADSPHADPLPDEATVAAFLRARPRFLAEHPDLYLALQPPRRVHGERLADHMAAMLDAERGAARGAAESARAAVEFGARAGRAVLALVGAGDPLDALLEDWPALLGLDAVHLADEAGPSARARALPAGAVRRLVPPGRDWVVRDWDAGDRGTGGRPSPAEAQSLHGEAAPLVARDALLRLDERRLLVLGTRAPAMLPLRGVAQHLLFLCRAASRAAAAG